jgi:hypothetical protein
MAMVLLQLMKAAGTFATKKDCLDVPQVCVIFASWRRCIRADALGNRHVKHPIQRLSPCAQPDCEVVCSAELVPLATIGMTLLAAHFGGFPTRHKSDTDP